MLLAPKNEVFCGRPVTARLANVLRNNGIYNMDDLDERLDHLRSFKNAGRKIVLEARILLGEARIVRCKYCGDEHGCITSPRNKKS